MQRKFISIDLDLMFHNKYYKGCHKTSKNLLFDSNMNKILSIFTHSYSMNLFYVLFKVGQFIFDIHNNNKNTSKHLIFVASKIRYKCCFEM